MSQTKAHATDRYACKQCGAKANVLRECTRYSGGCGHNFCAKCFDDHHNQCFLEATMLIVRGGQ